MRLLLVFSLLCAAGCGPKLIRSEAGWAVEGRAFFVQPIPDGRVMGDGWLLQNYKKVDKGTLQQIDASDTDLGFSRSADDGGLELEPIEWTGTKTLATLADRLISSARHTTRVVRVGNMQASVEEDVPTTELARAAIPGDDVEGYEALIEQRHPGEPTPFRTAYFAAVRRRGAHQVVVVTYANSPSAFMAGLPDARGLLRRVAFGGKTLPAEAKPLAPGMPRVLDPGTGDTQRL